LQVLEDGHITDSQGRKINFKNTVIIMTSNAGARNIVSPKVVGFIPREDKERDYEAMKKGVMDEVKQIFRPEFINRVDDIIVFHQLDMENIGQIARLMVTEVVKRLKEQADIELEVSDEVYEKLCKDGFDNVYGARPLRRTVQNMIEDELAQCLLDGSIQNGQRLTAKLDAEGKKVVFEVV
jgi:ATP-dependent Clp protease ATP-binding subunit ClpC